MSEENVEIVREAMEASMREDWERAWEERRLEAAGLSD